MSPFEKSTSNAPKIKRKKYVPTPEERERFGLQFIESRAVDAALVYAEGNRDKAAALLGVDARTLYRRLGKK